MSASISEVNEGSTNEKKISSIDEKNMDVDVDVASLRNRGENGFDTAREHAHRRLEPRHLQLITLAGGIGSSLFVLISSALVSGGPVSLVFGMLFWISVMMAISYFQMEITTLLPIDAAFINTASRFVDPAFGFGVGLNYLITSCFVLLYEITIINVVVSYWGEIHPAILITVLLVVFGALNLWNVKWFGEAEFWVATGKVILVFLLAFFTLVTMCGGNPIKDKYGFRYWNDPSPMVGSNAGERFKGFWSCIIYAAFAIVGPDYISLMSGEVKSPRKVLPKAYRSTTFRLLFFYGLGAFCVATICASDDPDLLTALKDGGGGAAKSPYVAAMKRMQIPYLGSVINAGVLISLLSTANTYVYTVSRSLHGLAVAGQAPKIFRTLNRNGVPYIAVIFALCFGCLSYLQVSAGTFRVIGWWVSITTTSEILTWWVMAWTFLAYRRALKAQDLDKGDFRPVKIRHGTFAAWYVIVIVGLTMLFQGYSLFMPGGWDGLNFFFSYAAMFVFLLAGASWKLIKRTKMVKPLEADFESDIDVITAYEVEVEAEEMGKPKSRSDKIWDLIM